MRRSMSVAVLTVVLLAWAGVPALADTPLTTAFTYQGRLKDGGSPASGTYDLQFSLYAAASGGAPIGTPVCRDNVSINSGLFTVPLDFGAVAFAGDQRFIEVAVRADNVAGNCDDEAFTVLTPRQPLTAAPYALYALNSPAGGSGNHWAAVGSDIHNTNSGRVGVGTSSPLPNSLLDVRGSVITSRALAFSDVMSGTSPGSVYLAAPENQALAAFTDGAERLRIDGLGNVGVGVTTPLSRLHVSGGPTRDNMRVDSDDPFGTWLRLGNTSFGGREYAIVSTGGSNFEGPGALEITDQISGAIPFLIDSDGDVGISVISPTARLHLNGDMKIEQNHVLELGAGYVKETNAGKISYRRFTSDSLEIAGAGVTLGQRRIRFYAEGGSTFTGTVFATAFTPTSDARLKTDVQPLAGTLDRLLALRGVSFAWRDDAKPEWGFATARQIGFLAQEVREVVPEAVAENGAGMLGVNYDSLMALVPGALRELRAQSERGIAALRESHEALRLANVALRAENNDLRSRVERLERAIDARSGE